MKKSKVIWLDRGFFASYYGFCPDETAWLAEIKRLGVSSKDAPYPDSDARTTIFWKDTEKGVKSKLTLIVTVSHAIDKLDDPIGVCGLFVHEAMHVWRHIREDMGEDMPSHEFEAYAIQFIFMQLMLAYSNSRKWKGKRK